MSKEMMEQGREETLTYLATLNREELCEFLGAQSRNFLAELGHLAQEAEHINSTSFPLLAATKMEAERILGEEYFKAFSELKEA